MNTQLKNQRLGFNFWIYSFASCVMKMYLNSIVDLPVKYDNTCLTVLFLIFNEQMYIKYLALSTGHTTYSLFLSGKTKEVDLNTWWRHIITTWVPERPNRGLT